MVEVPVTGSLTGLAIYFSRAATWAWSLVERVDKASTWREVACYLAQVRATKSKKFWACTKTLITVINNNFSPL